MNANIGHGPSVKKLGFIVNPVAGMGGAVGLKGTDGKKILKKARSLGAKPIAPTRAKFFLSELKLANRNVQLLVGAGSMGEDEATSCGFACGVLGKEKAETTAEDTMEIAREILGAGADLLVFCGGDGTARNILETVGTTIPVLGVPTGVKMHSSVFAVDPKASAQIAIGFLWGELALREVEVMDVDETAFRSGCVSSKLYGYLLTPYEPYLLQEVKIASSPTENELRNQTAIAIYIIETMKNDTLYIIGPGTTTRTIGDLLDAKKTLLGVDIFLNKQIVESDVNEKQILQRVQGKVAKIIVTPIGGQGFVFGRGNQQISPKVIHKIGLDNIMVVATASKLRSLKSLRVDTGDPNLDEVLRGHGLKIVTDYNTEYLMKIE